MSVAAPRTRECLSVVVTASGENFLSAEGMEPLAVTAVVAGSTTTDDRRPAAYAFLGDIVLRFVFTAKGCVDTPAHLEDVKRLDLTPAQALALATVNFGRAHGPPQASPFSGGVQTLCGGNPDVHATYLLDRVWWHSQLDRFAQGVLVALPRRGSLYFAHAADPVAAKELQRLAARLFHAVDGRGLSGYVYRFDAQGWHVHERLPKLAPGTAENRAPAPVDSSPATGTDAAKLRAERDQARSEAEQQDRLWLAAKGQKMVIYSILLNFLLRAIERNFALPEIVLVALYVCVMVYALVGVVRICSGLDRTQNQKILFMVATFFPFLNLAALVYLSVKASRLLRQAGWTVGWLGARP